MFLSKYLKRMTLLLVCFPMVTYGEGVESLSVGDEADFSQLQDQHGNAFEFGEQMALVLFVRGMETKDLVRDALAETDPRCLNDGQVVYVADIHKMPKMISKMVAIPRMRKLSYPVWLDRDGKSSSALPVAEEAVSVITVAKKEVVGVEYVKEKPALTRRLLEQCEAAIR